MKSYLTVGSLGGLVLAGEGNFSAELLELDSFSCLLSTEGFASGTSSCTSISRVSVVGGWVRNAEGFFIESCDVSSALPSGPAFSTKIARKSYN